MAVSCPKRGSRCPSSRSFTATPAGSRKAAAAARGPSPGRGRTRLARATGRRGTRDAVRAKNMDSAERTFAALAGARGRGGVQRSALRRAGQYRGPPHGPALSRLGPALADRPRARATLLRQSVRYCVKSERDWNHTPRSDRPARASCPGCWISTSSSARHSAHARPEDAWVDRMSRTIFEGTPEQAGEAAAAAALAEGIAPGAVGEAICAGRQSTRSARRRPYRPRGPGPTSRSAASTATRSASTPATRPTPGATWRRVSNPRNTVACLILGGYQVALDRVNRGGDFLHWSPGPCPVMTWSQSATTQPETLLVAARCRDPCQRPGPRLRDHPPPRRVLDQDPPAVFDLLLKFAVTEDGALHAEKYYRTVGRGVRLDPPRVPLASARGTGKSHRQRVRPAGGRRRGGP